MEKYNYIINPITKENILLNSEHGQIIFNTYAKQYGGAADTINNFLKTAIFQETTRDMLQIELDRLEISEVDEVKEMLKMVLIAT